jgi:hypothetical protein
MNLFNHPVRTYKVYNEGLGDYAVSKDRAEDIAGKTAAVLQKYTGPLAVTRIAGVRIPYDGTALALGKVRLPGNDPHTMLLTGRAISAPNGSNIRGSITHVTPPSPRIRSETIVSVMPTREDPANRNAAAAAARSIAVSFQLGGCVTNTCLMRDPLVTPPSEMVRITQAEDPLCVTHGGMLRALALAERVLC